MCVIEALLSTHSSILLVDLDPRSSFSEIIWRLGRLRDRGRITPGQHPCFYQDLPISREKYDKDFKRYPIEDFQAVFNYNVYVLIDQPGRVFIQSEPTRKQTFGNVWMPKDTLIFKGTLPSFYSLHSRRHLARRLRHAYGRKGRWIGPSGHPRRTLLALGRLFSC